MKKYLFLHVCIICVLVAVLSQISIYDITSLSYFSPTEKGVDFQSSDFYQAVAYSRNIRTLDDQIIIVPIDGLSRSQIVDLVVQIQSFNPSVIGLDVIFSYPTDDDNDFLNALKKVPQLVCPIMVERQSNEQGDCFATKNIGILDRLQSRQKGVVNLEIESPYNIVRCFRPYYSANSDTLSNFAVAIASKISSFHKEKLNKALSWNTDGTVYINYSSREFNIIEPLDIADNAKDLSNRIILLGSLYKTQDMHLTPINDFMPGVLIHAYSLSTILSGEYLHPIPQWLLWLLCILLSVVFVSAYARFKTHVAGDMIMRIFQVLMLSIIVYLGCKIFINYGYVIELSKPLLLVSLGIVALDCWKGILWLSNIVITRATRFILKF